MPLHLESMGRFDDTDSAHRSEHESGEPTGYMYMNIGEVRDARRCWEDCRRYGFLMAGHGEYFVREIHRLQPGHLVFAYLSKAGYVGLGRVTTKPTPQLDFVVESLGTRQVDLPLLAEPDRTSLGHPTEGDWCVGVEWLATLDRDEAICQEHFIPRATVCQMRRPAVVAELLRRFGVHSNA